MKRAYIGGTFDPITYGHLRMAEQVMDEIKPDSLSFLPCSIPNNGKKNITAPEHRHSMVELAIKNTPFSDDDRETWKEGVVYTVDTLREIKLEYPNDELYFVIGSDEFYAFEKWKEPDEILKLAKLVVMTRPSNPLYIKQLLTIPVYMIEMMPPMDVSSTIIRENVRKGKSIKYLTPDCVVQYIEQNNLYQNSGT